MPRGFVDSVRGYQTKQYWGCEADSKNVMTTRSGLVIKTLPLRKATTEGILRSYSETAPDVKNMDNNSAMSFLPFVTRFEMIQKDTVCDVTSDVPWTDKDIDQYEKDRVFVEELQRSTEENESPSAEHNPSSQDSTEYDQCMGNPLIEISTCTVENAEECNTLLTDQCASIPEIELSADIMASMVHQPVQSDLFPNLMGIPISTEEQEVLNQNASIAVALNPSLANTGPSSTETLTAESLIAVKEEVVSAKHEDLPVDTNSFPESEQSFSLDMNNNAIVQEQPVAQDHELHALQNEDNPDFSSHLLIKSPDSVSISSASPTVLLQMPQDSYNNTEMVTDHINKAMEVLPNVLPTDDESTNVAQPLIICMDFSQTIGSPARMVIGNTNVDASSTSETATKTNTSDTAEAARALMAMAHQPSPIKKPSSEESTALFATNSASTPGVPVLESIRALLPPVQPSANAIAQPIVSLPPIIQSQAQPSTSNTSSPSATPPATPPAECDEEGLNQFCVTVHAHDIDTSGQRIHKCTMCNKVFITYHAFKMHANTHYKNKNQCSVCGKYFTRSWLLKGHLRTHTGEKPYRCKFPGCDRAFADRSNLRSHTLIHYASDKGYRCTKCQRTFAQKRYLHKHLQEVCKLEDM